MHRAIWWHVLKVGLLSTVFFLFLVALAQVLPRWAVVVIFWLFALFVFFPAIFAVGPIGRRIGKHLNKTAISEAEKDR
ncbi:MAG: hypothetical protein DI563_14605 [Variovorax paradoxus]|uniref:Transmembrane protein n=1 Tax=Variovorax paradoxus TaxID=34073 RepID=A0A2W5Q8E4_VARPD|nr:MAG: hypothetical protein DI563_14605 [Variovorax paradoxus]